MRVLVVEDDVEMAETLGVGLRREGLAVDIAFDGETGLDMAMVNEYEVIVLDRDLPAMHGDDVCTELISAERPGKILMLTAAGAIEDRVGGLQIGADDYLPKPFAFAELVARIRALARRPRRVLPPVLVRGDLVLDASRMIARRGGRVLELNPKEFAVLEVLMGAQGSVVSAGELLERVWDTEADPFTSAVKVTVSRLRRKLGEPSLIQTVSRNGYRL